METESDPGDVPEPCFQGHHWQSWHSSWSDGPVGGCPRPFLPLHLAHLWASFWPLPRFPWELGLLLLLGHEQANGSALQPDRPGRAPPQQPHNTCWWNECVYLPKIMQRVLALKRPSSLPGLLEQTKQRRRPLLRETQISPL